MNRATFEFCGKEITLESPDAQMLQASIRRFSNPDFFFLIAAAIKSPVRRIVDVGACVGSYTLLFHEIWPSAEIWSIEPSSRNFDCLERNTKHVPNIHRLQLALGEDEYTHTIAIPTLEQKGHMNYGGGNCGIMSLFGKSDTFRESVQVCKLDAIMDWCDFIKIDTEGYEYNVIKGATRLLRDARPRLMIEFEPSNLGMAGVTAEQLRGLLGSHDYFPLGQRIYTDTVFVPKEKL